MVAYTDDGDESEPFYIVQDVWSQIRQEYIDKQVIEPLDVIISVNNLIYSDDVDLTSSIDFKKYSIISSGTAFTVKQSINAGIPYPLLITSGWRNPRRNDAVKGEVNSDHQYGNSVDFFPVDNPSKWPEGILTTDQVLTDMGKRAKKLLPNCFVKVHNAGSGNHMHVRCAQ